MNALSDLRAPMPCDRSGKPENEGHVFRGRFFDKCAKIEEWLIGQIDEHGSGKKPLLFGQRLKAVRDLAPCICPSAKKQERLLALLDRLQPHADLRATLGHARQTVATDSHGEVWTIFTPADRREAGRRIVLDPGDRKQALTELNTIANQLSQLTATASAPPPPMPA